MEGRLCAKAADRLIEHANCCSDMDCAAANRQLQGKRASHSIPHLCLCITHITHGLLQVNSVFHADNQACPRTCISSQMASVTPVRSGSSTSACRLASCRPTLASMRVWMIVSRGKSGCCTARPSTEAVQIRCIRTPLTLLQCKLHRLAPVELMTNQPTTSRTHVAGVRQQSAAEE